MSTVKAVTSPQIILAFLLVSVIATAAVVPFWESMTVSGTLLWSINTDQVRSESGRMEGEVQSSVCRRRFERSNYRRCRFGQLSASLLTIERTNERMNERTGK